MSNSGNKPKRFIEVFEGTFFFVEAVSQLKNFLIQNPDCRIVSMVTADDGPKRIIAFVERDDIPKKIIPKQKQIQSIPNIRYAPDASFRICSLSIVEKQDIQLDYISYHNELPDAILTDITLFDLFENSYRISNMAFYRNNTNTYIASLGSYAEIDPNVKYMYCDVQVTKISNKTKITCYNEQAAKTTLPIESLIKLRKSFGNDCFERASCDDNNIWLCYCGHQQPYTEERCAICKRQHNINMSSVIEHETIEELRALLPHIEQCNNAKEICNLIHQAHDDGMYIANADILFKELDAKVKSEKMFGNNKKACVQLIKDLLDQ